jgi:predicted lipid carrier protein YhbT
VGFGQNEALNVYLQTVPFAVGDRQALETAPFFVDEMLLKEFLEVDQIVSLFLVESVHGRQFQEHLGRWLFVCAADLDFDSCVDLAFGVVDAQVGRSGQVVEHVACDFGWSSLVWGPSVDSLLQLEGGLDEVFL